MEPMCCWNIFKLIKFYQFICLSVCHDFKVFDSTLSMVNPPLIVSISNWKTNKSKYASSTQVFDFVAKKKNLTEHSWCWTKDRGSTQVCRKQEGPHSRHHSLSPLAEQCNIQSLFCLLLQSAIWEDTLRKQARIIQKFVFLFKLITYRELGLQLQINFLTTSRHVCASGLQISCQTVISQARRLQDIMGLMYGWIPLYIQHQ